MKGSRILSVSPFSKLHVPLPRTPRQSQQLLNALTSSFRRQLDREYPTTPPSSDQSSTPGNSTDGDRSTDHHHSSAYATDRHLRTILENPLFSISPPKSSTSHGAPPAGNIDKQRLAKEPMVVFDELVASGSVTSYALHNCLKSQLLLASPHSPEGLVKALRDSRAGSKVVAWWFASDSETRKLLFASSGLIKSLTKFMVAEELSGVVFVWLRMLASGDLGGLNGSISDTQSREGFALLLNHFIDAEARYGGGLASCVRQFLDAYKMCTEISPSSSDAAVMRAGFVLCHLVVKTPTHAQEIPVHLYEDFRSVMSTVTPRSLFEAAVSLYHPTHPDTAPFLGYVERLRPGYFEAWPKRKRDFFMHLGFDALNILVDSDKEQECVYLARFMQQQLHGKSEQKSLDRSGDHAPSKMKDVLARLDLAFT
ncbi:hypothetical protein P175DRAFT_0492057 [Aspergillus ochraceoroseus IBT 24754]|uniref:Uncharacterized protein n=1 Tax=Aspergillus ochraceoroseus IBT 24754 TaxID=1392256 RepID=A0A2T5LYM2_9EURO|nr:uncharacterized protein P175DRAFT_0492057 [Aspergillus ochraceoroseus IBT 24754]PTU21381.1 hypothetical protein P175DRAFT_0492057 [Aspergillus ochraceoroseus IBT 24754]